MTVMRVYEENESPATQNEYRRSRCGSSCAVFIIILVVIIAIAIIIPLIVFLYYGGNPIVRVTIDSYEGMPTNESNTTFSPEFNITMYGIQEFFDKTFCYNDGAIHILYQGFHIATGPIVESCLRASNSRTVMLFAWGQNVNLPLYLENQLRDEMQRGVAVLEAEIDFDDYGSFTCWPVIGRKEYTPCS